MERSVTVLLDTSALLYWTLDPIQLSSSAARAIDGADQVLVSSIAIWEISIKVKRGKLVIPVSVREYAKRLKGVDRVEIIPVDEPTWIDSIDLDWQHRDPADRVMVATAKRFACPLVTSDATILRFHSESVW
jgi:PIN domain nuclease of toxin-antitoxin system